MSFIIYKKDREHRYQKLAEIGIDLYALTGFFGIIFYALSRFLMYRYR